MEGLIRQLLTLPQLQELTAGMAGREKHSMVTGLSPVQRAAVAAAAAEQTGRPLLMLCADEQECARQTADPRALTGEEPVVLPAREWQLRPAAAYSRQWEYRRLWALYRLAQEAPRVMVATAAAKAGLPFLTALLRGVLCNFLVCIAVWMSLAAQSVPGKLAAMYLPIFTFVLCGFEHSVANMFYLPAGILAAGRYGVAAEGLSWASMWTGNLLPVTLGNILGGCLVGVVYWAVYLRRGRRA